MDPEFLAHAVSGQEDALCRLARTIRPTIEKQLMRYPVTEDDREDLVQTTLVQVMRRLSSFRGDSSFSTWLFRVTANEALMLMRSQRRLRARVADVDLDDVVTHDAKTDAGATQHERERCVRDAVAELPEDYRDVVVAHYHLELGLQEIADQLAVTESTVRSRLHRARAKLRTLLAPYSDLAA